ncbi:MULTISPECIES: response regulator [unclassified Streptomyces]|uniref:response regulator n=1 Tax=unclassified Streptomyces TaxID=2593676 RepID=UPI0036DFE20E
MTLKVLVCDQLPIIRDGIHTLLEAESDIEVLDTTDSGLHAMMLVRTLHPDVVLTGLSLSGISGLELVRRIGREKGEHAPRVVVIALDGGDDMVAEALNAGVSGLLTRGATREELRSAVRAAADGHTMLAPEIAQRLVDWFRKHKDRPEPVDGDSADLTPRERQVLLLVAEGYSTEAVAEELCIGITTVRTHLHRLRTKLAVKDRSQLVSYAYRAGLVRSA